MCIHGPLNEEEHELPLQPLKAKLAATSGLASDAAGGLKQRGKQASSTSTIVGAGPKEQGSSTYSWEQVAQHSKSDDAWIVVKDRVYDVTAFAKSHPGGRVIYEFAGRDATDVFSAFHSPAAWGMLREHAVGRLQDTKAEEPIVADFRALKAELAREGLFRSNKLYYAWKVATTAAIPLAALALLAAAPGSVAVALLSAALMGLGLQQAGWLCHDFAHNQVFRSRGANLAASYVLGNFLQGFSVYWWKHKHNTHHALPNQISPDGHAAVDPDIDTLPFLAWSTEQLDAAKARGDKFLGLLRYQEWLVYPLLTVARLSWCQQSVEDAITCFKECAWAGTIELALIAAHYAWLVGGPIALTGSVWAGLAYWLVAEMAGGICLGYVFVQSHNGMEVYGDAKDFYSAQMVSTRDVEPSLWNDWFTGGLNYQIEHHLFPSMPRHQLHRAAGRVRALCERHSVPYESVSMGEAMRRVGQHLASIAKYV